MNEYIELIWTFIKIGSLTFGGGYAMIPVLEKELIRKKNWITMDEILDYYTIAQITPGIIAVNVSTFVGYKRKGIPGGLIATISFILPGVTLMTIVSLFISSFASHPLVQHAFAGIRIAVGALILNTILKIVKGCFKDARSVVIFIIAFAFSSALNASPVYILLGAGFLGWLLYKPKKTSNENGSGV